MEFGTHEELMALNGRYKYLYGLQTDALADDSNTEVAEPPQEESKNVSKAEDMEDELEQNGHFKTKFAQNGSILTSSDRIVAPIDAETDV